MWDLRNREQRKWGRLWYEMNPEWKKMPELWSCQRVQASSRELWKILEGFCFVCFCLFLSALVNRMFGVRVVTGADLGVLYTWLKTVKFGPQLFPWFLPNLSAVFLFSNTWDLLNESSHSYGMPTQTGWADQRSYKMCVCSRLNRESDKENSTSFFQKAVAGLLFKMK